MRILGDFWHVIDFGDNPEVHVFVDYRAVEDDRGLEIPELTVSLEFAKKYNGAAKSMAAKETDFVNIYDLLTDEQKQEIETIALGNAYRRASSLAEEREIDRRRGK